MSKDTERAPGAVDPDVTAKRPVGGSVPAAADPDATAKRPSGFESSHDSATAADPGNTAKRPAGGATAPLYRSVADGELHTPWTLPEYFASLNTVLRLPAKVRRKAEAAVKRAPGGERALAVFEQIRIPRWLKWTAAAAAVYLLVLQPLLSGGAEKAGDLTVAYGVWEAGKGRYQGRMFEIGANTIAFRTSSKTPDYTWHEIDNVRAKAAGDSTLYTVTYKEEGKTSDFVFWFVNGPKPFIRFAHQQDVVWTKSARQPAAKPTS